MHLRAIIGRQVMHRCVRGFGALRAAKEFENAFELGDLALAVLRSKIESGERADRCGIAIDTVV